MLRAYDLGSLLLGVVTLFYACSEPAATEPAETPSISEIRTETPINHEAIVRDAVRTECLQQTAGRQYVDAVATCRRLVLRSRNPFNVACLANALSQSVVDGGADATILVEAEQLIQESLRSAPAHPQRELWEQPARSTAAEIYAGMGDVARMNEAIEYLTWDTQEQERQDRSYYAELLRRAAQR